MVLSGRANKALLFNPLSQIPISTKSQRVNDQIRARELRVIGPDGSPLGVLSTEDALDQAKKAGLDLLEVSPNANPPVARILDYGAHRYRMQKQAQQQKKRQKKIEVKGVRIGMRISEHDFLHKVNQSRKFLDQGHKIKLELVMRGREQAYQLRDRAVEKIDQFINALEIPIAKEQKMTKQGNRLIVVLGKAPGSNKTPDKKTDTNKTEDNAKN